MRLVNVYVRLGRAFIPVQAQSESGIFVGVEPVEVSPLVIDALTAAIEKVLSYGHPRLPEPSGPGYKYLPDPVLHAASVRSWKQFASNGIAYVIGWNEGEIRLDISRLDSKGRWEYDPDKVHRFMPGTSLDAIVAVILADVDQRQKSNEAARHA